MIGAAVRPIVMGAMLVAVTGCATPTEGPTIHIGSDGWTADPQAITQTGHVFDVTLVNSLDEPIRFVVIQLNYGEMTDLPVVDGVLDVSRQVLYTSDDPGDPGPPVAAYYVIHPGVETEGAVGWEPAVLQPGEKATLTVGDPNLGGGEPGAFAVVSYEPGALERGDFARFDITDENGQVPMWDLEDFH